MIFPNVGAGAGIGVEGLDEIGVRIHELHPILEVEPSSVSEGDSTIVIASSGDWKKDCGS